MNTPNHDQTSARDHQQTSSTIQQHDETKELICSRKGCTNPALWKILWNNPSVHTPERRKAWLACDEHRAWLENYLGQRSFYLSTENINQVHGNSPNTIESY